MQVLISLTTIDNDYQQEQAASAEAAARRLGVQIRIVHAENDAIKQSQQLLEAIQSPAASRPSAIVLEPVGTALPKVAQAAAAACVGWVVLNREANYMIAVRKTARTPLFAISTDHVEVGRIQGRQMAALLPLGGTVLYIEGSSSSSASQQYEAEGTVASSICRYCLSVVPKPVASQYAVGILPCRATSRVPALLLSSKPSERQPQRCLIASRRDKMRPAES